METRTRSGRGEEKRKTSRNRTRVVDAIRRFHSNASSSLQTGVGACGHPIAPLARLGVCTRTSHREGKRVRATGETNGVGGGIRVGGGTGDVNGYTDGITAGTVAANQGNLEKSNEARRETQGTQSLSKNFRCIGSVFSLLRVIKYFRKKYL